MSSSDSRPQRCTTGDLSPVEATEAARKLWLEASCQSDLDEVERLYRWALSPEVQFATIRNDKNGKNVDESKPPIKKIKTGHCGLNPDQFFQAGEKLALYYCQSRRCKKAKKSLSSMGFTCRLAEQVLDYAVENRSLEFSNMPLPTRRKEKKAKKSSPCKVIDAFLSPSEVERLRSVFESPLSSYWTNHNYAVDPPSPYFSYVIPLKDIKSIEEHGNHHFGFIGDLIHKIISCPLLNDRYEKLQQSNFAEIWAHNRPHASGHQLHFDSDDEGREGVRHPIISTILYVTGEVLGEEGNERAAGGPSLVTNQKLTDVRLATKGWMAHPKLRRLVAFDGRYLHGVVPGKGFQKGRRVTLMLAFWENIRVRRGVGPGSARPFPCKTKPRWASQLLDPSVESAHPSGVEPCVETDPIALDSIYETLDGEMWKTRMGMPSYDQVFQGF